MTRENKVALVVGFALVLFVGILISDHLSDAQTRRSADLAPPAARTAATAGRAGARLLDLRQEPRPRRTGAVPAVEVPITAAPSVRPVPDPARPEAAPAQPAAPRPTAEASATTPPAPRYHDVRPGESLSVIAQRCYGSVRFTDALAAYNGLADPNELRAGHHLRLPPAEELGAAPKGTAESRPPDPPAEAGPAYASYEVKPGDSLSAIASRFLGSPGRWRDLYELNRDVIDDPDNVRAGSVIRVPTAAGG
jgi:nucleoid-associated protein YgaU